MILVFVVVEKNTKNVAEIMIKSKIPKIFERDVVYIICPDIDCEGFYSDILQCDNSTTDYGGELCPHQDIAYQIHIDFRKHHIKVPIDICSGKRIQCDCSACIFQSCSNYYRIKKEDYEKYIKDNKIKLH